MIDLSHTLHTAMPVYPGDPEVTIGPALTLADDGVAVTNLHLGSHSGTHLDAPSHTVVGGRELDAIHLDELVGEAHVFHVRDLVSAGYAITAADLGLDELSELPSIVLIDTGWDQYFGDDAYLQHPFVDPDAADRLWQLGMRVLGVDVLSPDPTPSEDFAVHEVVLGRDGLIVENLRGLGALAVTERVGFFPLALGAVDGAPVRAVAFE